MKGLSASLRHCAAFFEVMKSKQQGGQILNDAFADAITE